MVVKPQTGRASPSVRLPVHGSDTHNLLMLIEVRANLFALSFYIVTALFLLIGSPLLFAPRS
ncbi:MAG: hypothetical protein AAFY53_11985, partial [Pseudomonadota bacterium]